MVVTLDFVGKFVAAGQPKPLQLAGPLNWKELFSKSLVPLLRTRSYLQPPFIIVLDHNVHGDANYAWH